MSVGIVCMINNTHLEEINHHNLAKNFSFKLLSEENSLGNNLSNHQMCAFKKVEKKDRKDGPFAWGKQIQGLVLSSFFYGYLLTQV